MRKAMIAGNWKMNNTISEGVKLIEELKDLVKDSSCDVVVCPTFLSLESCVKAAKGTNIKIGAQNMHFEKSGAFTGEVSVDMLKELGIEYVIIGHSERRQYFNETDETVNKKVKVALENKIVPILCCGESLEQREGNTTEAVIEKQVTLGLQGIDKDEVKKVVIAYEPIWAIGTGKTATSEQANDTIKFIRTTVAKLYGNDIAEEMRILYGGSVKSSTIKEQMAMSDIDGGLVGGASLKASEFAAIVNY
ncbi:triosephosphate isomerase [Clostridium collagenovorans DSM 3089]|uniref:Triosephosphate isomerase n=1 Tax=Clostridium collagenovorans DSM 3089 TaxID=1121306 RepID=A0A1M5XZD7_9CLOT|nr:triose-phosphate isomerase [Clostridium collagenovorans]SHI05170.1 triosephosphate isomerase [Clostridium collagenovorans DSM 3089]